MKTTPSQAASEYARVLQFVHWAFEQPEAQGKSIGELLRLGCETHKVSYPTDPKVEEALLVSAFELASKGVPYTKVSA